MMSDILDRIVAVKREVAAGLKKKSLAAMRRRRKPCADARLRGRAARQDRRQPP